MINIDITVNLESTGNPDPAWQVTFPEGGDITVATEVDTITWVIGSAPIRAEITAVDIAPGEPGNVPWNPPNGLPTEANGWVATDDNDVTETVSWEYTVTITYQGIPYISDPKITNQPPTHLIHQPPPTHLNRVPLNQ